MRLRVKALVIVVLTMLTQFLVLAAVTFAVFRSDLAEADAIAILCVTLLLSCVASAAAIVGVLDRRLMRRVTRLTREIALVGLTRDPSHRVTVGSGTDEIAQLAGDVNETLAALADSERELRESGLRCEIRVKDSTEELARSEERFRDLVEHLADAVFLMDNEGRLRLVNHRAERLTGYPRDRLLEMVCDDLVDTSSVSDMSEQQEDAGPFAHWVWEAEVLHAEGRRVPVELHAALVYDAAGVMTGTIWMAHDITRRKRSDAELLHMANHDHLTNLFNRRRLEEELDLRLARRDRRCEGAVLWLDIDHFKDVNDSLGHRAGDEVLVGLANYLREHVRGYLAISRIGGDEFAVVLADVSDTEAATAARRILDDINALSFPIDGHLVRVGVSMGVVAFPRGGTTARELLAKADAAMHYAKETGRGRLHLYVPDDAWHAEISSRLAWSERIAQALEDDSFLVYAQPILRLSSEAVARYELLIRMSDGNGGVVPPAEFLPAAERLGLIQQIDRWMTKRAISLLSTHSDAEVCLDVNLSGKAFDDGELLTLIADELRRGGVPPSRLGFEITETAAIGDIARAREFIREVKSIGCRVSLDDFGSGFSSFYYLKHLPIDYLKIDGNFIRDLPNSTQDQHLVRALVELCRSLGIEAVAEYVEDAETLELLRELGMDFGQGYHIGRPEPLEDVLAGRGVERDTA